MRAFVFQNDRNSYESGQRCLAGSVVLSVGDKTHEEIRSRIVGLAKEVIVGDGMDSETQLGPVISKEARERISALIQSAIDEGATVLLDGRLNNEAVLISHKPCDLTKLCSYPTNPVTSLLMKVTQYQYVLTIYMCASFLSFFSKICV